MLSEKKNISLVFFNFSILCLIYFFNIIGRIIFSPLSTKLISDLKISHLEIGNLFFILSISFGFSLFFSQFLSRLFSHKDIIFISSLLSGVALLSFIFAQNFLILKYLLIVLGLGTGLFMPSSISIITLIFSKDQLGKVFGMWASVNSVAFISAPIIVQFLSFYFSWKTILFLLGSIILFSSFFIKFFLQVSDVKSEQIDYSFFSKIIKNPSFWLVVLLLCLATGLNVGIYNMSTDYYLYKQTISEKQINLITIIGRIFGIFTAMASGYFIDKFGLQKAIFFSLSLCGITTFFMGISNHSHFFFILQAPLAIAFTPIVHFAIANLSPKGKNAPMVACISSIGFVFGSGIVPQLLGLLGYFKIYELGFIILGIFSLLIALLFSTNKLLTHEKGLI